MKSTGREGLANGFIKSHYQFMYILMKDIELHWSDNSFLEFQF